LDHRRGSINIPSAPKPAISMASICRLSALTGLPGAELYRPQLEDLNRVFADGFEP
jgi:hypothetical protein